MLRIAALYCRLSPRPDGTYEGVDAQERWGREYAARRWPGVPVEVFADAGISAASDDHRPEYERIKEQIVAGRVAYVWTVEQTRLERREVGWFELAAILDAAGIDELHTNRDGIVRVRDDVAGIKAVLAAGEVRKLKRRVRDRMDQLAAEGRPAGAVVFGYAHGLDEQGRKALHIIPEQAEAIRWAAAALLSGWSITAIADELNARGHRGAQGARLRTGSVRSFMTSPTIAGRRVHRGEDVGAGNWEPILAPDVWQAVRARLAGPRIVRRRDGRDYPVTAAVWASNRGRTGRLYILTGGLAVCGVCGAPLAGARVTRDGRKVAYLRCTPNRGGKACVGILLEPVDRYVTDKLFAELDKPEFLEQIGSDEHVARREALLAEIEAVGGKRRQASRRWSLDEISDSEWQEIRDALDEREQTARATLAALPPPAVQIPDIATVRALWDDPDSMTLDERREFLRIFIERVIVKRAPVGRRAVIDERVDVVLRT